LAGRLRDPLLGRDLLFGAALGIAFALIFGLGYLLSLRGGAPPQMSDTDFLLGARSTLAKSMV
jgi:hypothetical protein